MAEMEDEKRAAAFAAVDRYVPAGACIGLGTGSTAYWAIVRVGERVAAGESIRAVATSQASERQCRELGIELVPFGSEPIRVAIDGADEVSAGSDLIKGGGGALFREKAVALAAQAFIVIVDEGKLVSVLGRFPLPVEVVPFAAPYVRDNIAGRCPGAAYRTAAGEPFITDNGNMILDCPFGQIDAPAKLDRELREVHGVVATGLFSGLATRVIVGRAGGVREIVPDTGTSRE